MQLLVSVRNLSEAQVALLGAPIGVLDLKEPQAGALGAVDLDTVSQCVSVAQGHCPVSATIGDLPPDPHNTLQAIEQLVERNVDYIKVGMFTPDYLHTYLASLQACTENAALVAVLFADRFHALKRPVELLAQAGFRGVMLDTADKNAGALVELMRLKQITAFVQATRAAGMLCGLAGSLRLQDIATLAPLSPDYLGFRTALCENTQRNQSLSAHKLKQVTDEMRSLLTADVSMKLSGVNDRV